MLKVKYRQATLERVHYPVFLAIAGLPLVRLLARLFLKTAQQSL
jgi:hypothetical protein